MSDYTYTTDNQTLDPWSCDTLNNSNTVYSNNSQVNDSWYTQASEQSKNFNSTIPVITDNRPAKLENEKRNPVRKTIRRNNNTVLEDNLPTLACYNMRSLFPKIKNLAIDIIEREIGLACLNEIWEKNESKEHQNKLIELFEMDGLQYISNPRKVKRGGGSAIIANVRFCNLEKLSIIPPRPLEVVWGIVKPKLIGSKFKKIIVASFYCPPKSKKRDDLIDHLTLNLQMLLLKHPNAGIVIAGDRNDLSIEKLLTIDHSLRQIVLKNTRKNKCLDVILTNMANYYNEPNIFPPPGLDIENQGVPSDHSVPVSTPITTTNQASKREYTTRRYRQFPDSGIRSIGQWLTFESNFGWDQLRTPMGASQSVQRILTYEGSKRTC